MDSLSLTAFSLLFSFINLSFAGQTMTVTVLEKPGITTTIAGPQSTAPTATTHSASTLTTSTVPATSSQAPGRYGAASPSSPAWKDGAAGTHDSSFDLSTGGMIAVIVVVVFVVVFGIGSTVLFFIAKRRQWKVRESIKRASRRLTGRRNPPRRSEMEKRKRSGIVAGSRRTGTTVAHPPGQKQGLAIEVKDVEKGGADVRPAEKSENRWTQRLMGNSWK